jgi:hypothetical protein
MEGFPWFLNYLVQLWDKIWHVCSFYHCSIRVCILLLHSYTGNVFFIPLKRGRVGRHFPMSTVPVTVYIIYIRPLKTGCIMVWQCPSVTLLIMTVSIHFLSDGQIDSNDIWYTDVSWRDADKVRIWVWSNIIKEFLPLDLENFLKISFRSFFQWWLDGLKRYLVCIRVNFKKCLLFGHEKSQK